MACPETTPDLTFIFNTKPENSVWRNTNKDSGSDHMIIEIKITPSRDTQHGNNRTFEWADWETLRNKRDIHQESSADKIDDIAAWIQNLSEDIRSATQTTETDIETPKVDSRLAHLIEAKNSVLSRWEKQRVNRRLRKKIAEINRTTEEHCQTFCKQQWNELCNEIDGQLYNGKS
ncbi:hypothetical protein HPB50_021113 [Hyalomma asiaticum]|uniref:Uncharacterized protein n=1 Tax=Hyalomma asiaticum TaxID=266040 RepID=A0ACB7TND6_HYAAI|nr:hypothetical protein HPB50_021113 [Hyalomma asiaticum]